MRRAKKKELGDWCENGSEDRDAVKMQLPPCEICSELDEYEREEQWLTKQSVHMAVLRNNHTNRSSVFFALPYYLSRFLGHTFVARGQLACATPTNTNMHVSVKGYVEWAYAKHTLQMRTPSISGCREARETRQVPIE